MSDAMFLEPWQLPDAELLAGLSTSQADMDMAYARQIAFITEVEKRRLAAEKGCRSTAALLTLGLRISPQQAKTRVAQATLDLPRTRKALAAGDITAEHAHVIAHYLAQAPDRLDPAQYAADEETLVSLSRQANPAVVHRLGRRLKAYWDLGGTPPKDRENDLARPHREFRYNWTRDGRLRFNGEVDPETGKLVEDLMVPLAKPRPVDENGNADPRTSAERQGDAFAALVDLAARAPDLPVKAGERAVATVTISLDDLKRNAGIVFLDGGDTMTVSQLRRQLCDAKVYPAVLGGESRVLDLGHSARTAIPAQRRALALRDKGCTRPGCGRGPKWTSPHHIRHWVDGGTTDLDDMTLVCESDHRLIHHGGWDVELRDGVVYWIPPPWIDPERKPLRNTAHDQPRRQCKPEVRCGTWRSVPPVAGRAGSGSGVRACRPAGERRRG